MKKQKLLLGISGKMGSGKSTISHMLKAAFGDTMKVEIMSLSKPIYKAQDLLYKEYGLTLEGDKDRDLLIAIGLWGRGKSSNFWLEQMAKMITESDADVIICDDVRFENEADFFDRLGFLVRIEGKQRGNNVDRDKATDATETALDNYKFKNIVSNLLPPDEMCKQIGIMMGGKNEKK